nr:uncharacterized mitochondrial protein AtMg00810-like [Tanacetum cinerariifolium]
GELFGISGKHNVSQMISQDMLIDFYQIVLWIFIAILQRPTDCGFSMSYKPVKTEMELELEQTQQGSSHEVSDYGFKLTGFSDADYAGCKDTFKSTSGGAQFLGEKLNIEHGRIILESVEHSPLNWPSIKVDGVTRLKKYAELFASEKLQADRDLKVTYIILQGLPTDVYALVNYHLPIASPSLSLFHNDPYMKVLQAFYAKEAPILPPSYYSTSYLDSIFDVTTITTI